MNTDGLTRTMRDVLVIFLADAEQAAKDQPFGTIKALRRRGMLIGNVLTPQGKAAATEIKRSRVNTRWVGEKEL